MQSVISENEPFDDVLLREGNITITSTRLEIKNKTYALKYISTVTLSESHPPRGEAMFVMVVSGVALLVVLLYAVLGKVTLGAFFIYFAASLLALATGGLVYWLDPSKYSLKLDLVNGEVVNVDSKSERFVHRVHKALSTSLAMNRLAPETLPFESQQARHGVPS